ncbi:restriction endonuclease subunit S [Endozoicomonas gorgoniicola]|uniref:Restriction endonuclease subunit S n=1 Tax=Endozoicomonas gorgoniicola TaxID=1234144 RepID=A0ABT3MWW8_9GAMM|nr:restriction endonuclease subunit S [Endozoicomonas gorgoniicola]MCW7553863.1 restriction endonuclease subunit S [Endozoicomonas gorgoniicola]
MASDILPGMPVLPENWEWKALDSLCDRVSVGHVGETSSVFCGPEGIPFLRSQNVRPGVLEVDDIRFVPHEFHKKSKKSQLKPGDILVVRVGHNRGDCCVVPDNVGDLNCANIVFARPSDTRYSNFLGYFLNSAFGRASLLAVSTGSAQAVLNTKSVAKVLVPVPPVHEAAEIGKKLRAFDDKTQLNRQTNQTLENMAQALFKSWFVDFDPVIDNALAAGNTIPEPLQKRAEQRQALRASDDAPAPLPEAIRQLFPASFVFDAHMGWIPEGWGSTNLGSLVTVKRGGSPRPIKDFIVDDGLPWVKISDATASSTRFISGTKEFIREEGLKKTVYLKKGSLILSNSATPGLPKFLDLDACIHDGWLYFPNKEKFSDTYLYQLFLVIREELVMQGNGSVFTNLKTDILKAHKLVVPIDEVLTAFEEQIVTIHKRVLALEEQTLSLTKLRDTLLPKLISGEFRIPEAQQKTEAAVA